MSSAMLFAGLLSLAQPGLAPGDNGLVSDTTPSHGARAAPDGALSAPGSVLDPSKAVLADSDDDYVPPPPPPAPTATEPAKEVDVHANVDADSPGNWMGTLAVSALAGGLVGALVGTSIYLLDRPDSNAVNITYWAAGGVLLGVGIGVVQIALQEDRVSEAMEARVLDDSPPEKVVGITVPF